MSYGQINFYSKIKKVIWTTHNFLWIMAISTVVILKKINYIFYFLSMSNESSATHHLNHVKQIQDFIIYIGLPAIYMKMQHKPVLINLVYHNSTRKWKSTKSNLQNWWAVCNNHYKWFTSMCNVSKNEWYRWMWLFPEVI